MATERNVVDFKIHNLTEEQFQELKAQGKIDPNAVYCTPDTTKERLDALETKTTSLEENKQDIATAVNYDNITNCITEIPQDIKLELADGTLTLKAGSKIYSPDGTPVDVTVDRIYTGTVVGTYKGFVFCGSGGVITTVKDVNKVTSGATEPTNPSGLDIFFNTNTKTFRIYSGTQWADWNVKYPVAVVSVENGVIASIDQVFNGFGYMGSTAFILPGVKGLISNGRNADGTLNNKNFTVPSLFLSTITTGSYSGIFVLATTGMNISSGASEYEYDSERNVIYNKSSGNVYSDRIIAGFRSVSNGKIESLTPKTAFHAVDYSDLEEFNNSVTAWSNAKFLPLAGGTMTGSLIFSGAGIRQANNSSLFSILGSTSSWNAPLLAFYGYENATSPGSFLLRAGDGTNNKDLIGRPDGTLLWDGKGIVRTTSHSKAQNGYYKFSNGLIIQWGRIAAELASTTGTVTFPTAFTSANAAVQIEHMAAGNSYFLRITSITSTSFSYSVDKPGSSNANPSAQKTWIAIGY